MLGVMKKVAYTGIGLAFLAGMRAGKITSELAELGKISEREGEELLREFRRLSEIVEKEAKERINSGMKDAMERLQLGRREEITRLEQQIAELRAEIEHMREAGEQNEC